MKSLHRPTYAFGNFIFDADKLVLFHDGAILEKVDQKSLEVLAAILASPDRVGLYDRIIDDVWPNDVGADSLRVNQYASRVQKKLEALEPGTEFLKNIRGRGYAFVTNVTLVKPNSDEARNDTDSLLENGQPASLKGSDGSSWLKWRSWLLITCLVIVGSILVGWNFWNVDEENEVRRVVRESQMFESLNLYANPAGFIETDLDRYWTSEFDGEANYDRGRIRQTVSKLAVEGRRYGEGSKCEIFDFQTVEINSNNDRASVRTFEKWLLADYSVDGNLLKVKTVGPYFVDYLLRKIDGRWLVEKSTTARTVRPTPLVLELQLVTAPSAGQEFLVSLFGSDFEPTTVYLEVVGKDCPETKPCKVDNGALLERAKLTNASLENVPLTLSSGEFRIYVRNGDSKPSAPQTVVVP